MLHSSGVTQYQRELLAAREVRLARMGAAARPKLPPIRVDDRALPRPQFDPTPVIKKVKVDFGDADSRRLKYLEAQRVRLSKLTAEREKKELVRWCRGEIWRCKRAVSFYERRKRRLAHGRKLSDAISEHASAIITDVMRRHGIEKEEILARPLTSGRSRSVTPEPLYEAMWRLRHETSPRMSLSEIGTALGGRDHTTALYSIRKYQRLIDAGFVKQPAPLKK